jgi:WD40 repeat protein
VSSNSVESTTKSNVWRVAWNATGTVLATSAEDGTLSLWRRDFAGEWINVQDLPSGGQQQMTFLYQNP